MLVALGTARAGFAAEPAAADLLQARDHYQPGEVVLAGLRLVLQEGWHTYWANPGEGGMPVSIQWTLPEGWKAGPLLQPVPERFRTGDLASFGYAGEVVMPVRLHPPPGGGGPVVVKAEVAWLNCDEEACVPGDAVIEARWDEGAGGDGAHAATIKRALARVPQSLGGARLEVSARGERLVLELWLPEGIGAGDCEVFPLTPNVVEDSGRIRFREEGGRWLAETARHAYAAGPPAELELVLAGGSLEKPWRVRWQKNGGGG